MHQSEDQHEDLIFSDDEDESAPAFPNNTFEFTPEKGFYHSKSNDPCTSKKATASALDTLPEIGLVIEQSPLDILFWNELGQNDAQVTNLANMSSIDPASSQNEVQVSNLLATTPQAIPHQTEPPPLMNESASASPASSISDFSDSSSMSLSSFSNDSSSIGDFVRNDTVGPQEGSIDTEDKDAEPMQVDQATEVSVVSVGIEMEPTEDLTKEEVVPDREDHIAHLRKKVAQKRKVLMRAVNACGGNGRLLRAEKAYREVREELAAVMAVKKLKQKEVSIRKFYEKREMYKKSKGVEIPKPTRKSPRLNK